MYPWCRAAQGPVPLLLALLGLPGLKVLLRPPHLQETLAVSTLQCRCCLCLVSGTETPPQCLNNNDGFLLWSDSLCCAAGLMCVSCHRPCQPLLSLSSR